MKRLLRVLRTTDANPQLEPQPGLDDITALVEQVRHTGLDVQLRMNLDSVRAPAGIELSAYRVVQEALTNVIKHSDARQVRVDVRAVTGFVEVELVDDGRRSGASATSGSAGKGHGLVGIRERVALYRGDLEVGPGAQGYRVWARFPFEGGQG